MNTIHIVCKMQLMELLPHAVQYSGSVFVVGFVFGVIRNVWANSVIGEDVAIMIEIPLMLTASWIIWQRIALSIEKTYVVVCDGDFCRREKKKLLSLEVLQLGSLSFLYLMVYEFVLGKILVGETIASFIMKILRYPNYIGLIGQIGFGLIPVIRHIISRDSDDKRE